MFNIKCKVLFVQDEKKTLPIKDKNGVPTQLTKEYRFVTIQAMTHDQSLKIDRPIVIKSVDPSFDIPKPGAEYDTPDPREIKFVDGVPHISI